MSAALTCLCERRIVHDLFPSIGSLLLPSTPSISKQFSCRCLYINAVCANSFGAVPLCLLAPSQRLKKIHSFWGRAIHTRMRGVIAPHWRCRSEAADIALERTAACTSCAARGGRLCCPPRRALRRRHRQRTDRGRCNGQLDALRHVVSVFCDKH